MVTDHNAISAPNSTPVTISLVFVDSAPTSTPPAGTPMMPSLVSAPTGTPIMTSLVGTLQ